MGILGKLFQKSAVVKADTAAAVVPRAPRVKLEGDELDAAFLGHAGTRLKVLNLSTSGALLQGQTPLERGANITGQLQLGELTVEASARVVHVREHALLGIAFTGETPELPRAIQAFLATELLTLKMVRVAPQFLKPEPDGTPVWFSAGAKCQLHYVYDAQGSVLRCWILALGSRADWRRGRGVRTGVLEEVADGVDRLREDAALFQEDQHPNDAALKPFRRIVAAVESLDPAHRSQLLAALRPGTAATPA